VRFPESEPERFETRQHIVEALRMGLRRTIQEPGRHLRMLDDKITGPEELPHLRRRLSRREMPQCLFGRRASASIPLTDLPRDQCRGGSGPNSRERAQRFSGNLVIFVGDQLCNRRLMTHAAVSKHSHNHSGRSRTARWKRRFERGTKRLCVFAEQRCERASSCFVRGVVEQRHESWY
jgi:hypothetical protein